MFIGVWNKSVILTYFGLLFSVIGMYLAFTNENILYAFSCLMVSGVCDLFDGKVARMCKRTEKEKKFGVELDSLADTVCFVVFPIIILLNMGLTKIYHVPAFCFFALAGVARLGYFNVSLDEDNLSTPVKYYSGLPVTAIAMLLPLAQLISILIGIKDYSIYYLVIITLIGLLNILNIKIKKPGGLAYPIAAILAVIMLVLFIGVL